MYIKMVCDRVCDKVDCSRHQCYKRCGFINQVSNYSKCDVRLEAHLKETNVDMTLFRLPAGQVLNFYNGAFVLPSDTNLKMVIDREDDVDPPTVVKDFVSLAKHKNCILHQCDQKYWNRKNNP